MNGTHAQFVESLHLLRGSNQDQLRYTLHAFSLKASVQGTSSVIYR